MIINDIYDSPIRLIEQMRDQIECDLKDGIFRVTKKYAIDIDEEKLLQALRHDRERYSSAYHAGYNQAIHDIAEGKIDVTKICPT